MGRACTVNFLSFFLKLRGREGGWERVVFFSLIRILISSLGGLFRNNYYTYSLSGRQLDKTESFFLVARLQRIFILSHN